MNLAKKTYWIVLAALVVGWCGAGRAQENSAPDSSALPESLAAAPEVQSIEDLREEFNQAIADLSARLNEARNRQAQASVDGVLYLRWSDDIQQAPGRNQFEVDRAYVNVRGTLPRRGLYRVTLDVARPTGERLLEFLKYAYGGIAVDRRLTVAMGLQQTPLVDFQEGVWKHRYIARVLSDAEGKLGSGDLGIGAEGVLTSALAYKMMISNGEGVNKAEADRQKDLALRLTYTLRPGLRASAFGYYGLIDTSAARAQSQARHRYDLFISYEKARCAAYVELLGAEDQAKTHALRMESGGASLGGFYEFVQDWRAIGRVDVFDPDRQKPDNAHARWLAGLSYNIGTNLGVALTDQWVTYGALAGVRNSNQVFFQMQVTY